MAKTKKTTESKYDYAAANGFLPGMSGSELTDLVFGNLIVSIGRGDMRSTLYHWLSVVSSGAIRDYKNREGIK